MSAPIVALAVLLAFAAAWELAAENGERTRMFAQRVAGRLSSGRIQSLAEAALAMGLADRLERAGFAGRFGPSSVLAAKAGGVLLGLGCAAVAVPALPGRLGLAATPMLAVAGFLAPDALLERAARRRQAAVLAALPDTLDILAVGVAAGRAPGRVMRDLAGEGTGPLAAEMAMVVADLDCGSDQGEALGELRRRVGGPELAVLAASLERSRKLGSPLADQLAMQASALRVDASRRVEENAARAAPKIQLVVALVLVPSVLLMILAAILAHSDELLGSLR